MIFVLHQLFVVLYFGLTFNGDDDKRGSCIVLFFLLLFLNLQNS
jgi:hypothetical protein